MKPIRVLVVDDSATMRLLVRNALRADPQIEIVGEARDALEARTTIKELSPDVVTLDIEMPNMSGLDFLEKIMRLRPTPVIMVSTLTSRGASETIRALELGAFDCVCKPTDSDPDSLARLPELVRAAANSPLKRRIGEARSPQTAAPVSKAPSTYRPDPRAVIAIGSSTGGVEALIAVMSQMPANCPPIVITQHMPQTFTKSFAERLDRLSQPTVTEACDGDMLEPGRVYLAPGGTHHLEVVSSGTRPRCRLRAGDTVSGHRPSVDVLFHSVAKLAGPRAVGVILTGMGRDGADGLLAMRKAGAHTIGQDAATCIVYGMPKVAFELGAVEKQLPLGGIANELISLTRSSHQEKTHGVSEEYARADRR